MGPTVQELTHRSFQLATPLALSCALLGVFPQELSFGAETTPATPTLNSRVDTVAGTIADALADLLFVDDSPRDAATTAGAKDLLKQLQIGTVDRTRQIDFCDQPDKLTELQKLMV